MSAWKYVMFSDKHGRRFPVVFPAELVHSDVAEAIQHAVRSGELDAGLRDWSCPEPISAGSVGYLQVDLVGGASETLGMPSLPEDASIINNYPYARGMGHEPQKEG